MGPLCGIFDQRAAERLNHHADMYGFDAISAGGVLSWLMECLDQGLLEPEELGVRGKPAFSPDGLQRRGRLDAQRRVGRRSCWTRSSRSAAGST